MSGITILDLTRLLPGAVATQQLLLAGAEVIKIEQPGQGDYARTMPPLIDGAGAVFLYTNGGKSSLTLDLKSAGGRVQFLRLCETADAVVEGFRPGVMDRLGLSWDRLRETNSRLIYASLTGYPAAGEWAMMAGHDINYLALSGVLDLLGGLAGVQIADILGGSMQMVNSILLALLERHRTGQGSRVEVNMLEGVDPLLILPRALLAATGSAPRPGTAVLSGKYPCYRLYTSRDGSLLALGALEEKFWMNLCRALGRDDLIPMQFTPEAIETLAAIFREKTAQEWFQLLKDRDCCLTPVLPVQPGPPLT
ncbi:MAG: CoA transferase [Acidobacteriia bacterium]|nr:CoA transferase [Terriglobia bacterium]